ncbi:hypothetical protein ACFY0P_48610 [Streptomyces sp. NPDC001714]|uniref:hypothetical protein n=1 Tax=Streptomyces sp. NPDC001714 TaxID=3364603 RepID=UPI0036B38AE9
MNDEVGASAGASGLPLVDGVLAGAPDTVGSGTAAVGSPVTAGAEWERVAAAEALRGELERPGGYHRGRARAVIERLTGVPLGTAQETALAAAPAPVQAIQWIRESPNSRLLASLVPEDHPLSRELLDELPPSRNQHYIRQLLVHTGVLAARNEDLERIPGWLEHELADKPLAHANLARPFLH